MTIKIEELDQQLDDAIAAFAKELREQALAEARETLRILEPRIAAAERLAAAPNRSVEGLPLPVPKAEGRVPVDLPTKLTWASLIAHLRLQRFDIVDNRSGGGAVWVLDPQFRFKPYAEALAARGISSEFKAGRRRQPGPQYWIDPAGRLRDA